MDETDIQQVVEQRKESYDMEQIDKEFKASIPVTSHEDKPKLQNRKHSRKDLFP